MHNIKNERKYAVAPGPEAYLCPAAALMGILPPVNSGDGIVAGENVAEDRALDIIAEKLVGAKKPAVCPGPMLLWDWSDGANDAAAAVRELAETCGAKILPMIDYSAKRMRPDMEISPNHPNVTIAHNDIDVCLFAGVHHHYVNFALRLIRGRTNCYTIVLSDHAVAEEAMVSIGKVDVKKINAITERVKTLIQK